MIPAERPVQAGFFVAWLGSAALTATETGAAW